MGYHSHILEECHAEETRASTDMGSSAVWLCWRVYRTATWRHAAEGSAPPPGFCIAALPVPDGEETAKDSHPGWPPLGGAAAGRRHGRRGRRSVRGAHVGPCEAPPASEGLAKGASFRLQACRESCEITRVINISVPALRSRTALSLQRADYACPARRSGRPAAPQARRQQQQQQQQPPQNAPRFPPAGRMSLPFLLGLLCLRHLIAFALAHKETLPPRAQFGDAPLRAQNSSRSGGRWASRSASATSSSSAPSSYSSPSGGVRGSGSERSSFQWSPTGRRTGSLYCRVGIGFHLQIHPDGKVNGSHQASLLSILEIFAVSQGIVGIRGVFSNKFLAMSKKGKLHASAKFTDDCKFRERFQENSYNTYASAVYRTEKTGREWYVALNKRGKAKRGCSPRVKPQHLSTHFLPRFRQVEPPELSFTVTVPEKKKPPVVIPAKPKVPMPVPRKNSPPVKYRLKFRFG
ncbi:fibroblast growth factor 5 [Eublepharis macularius]|uniref:Fibroblast growth factor n=1 Tax=Eublepharis macularius TaxID=481883 RepID=A0AA97L8Q7_EUBMA|nr:fibroblast growth factor 5 [Eublepharis macularius]